VADGSLIRDLHVAAALLLARSNNTEDAMGEFIPQDVYDELYGRKMLTLASDQTGESWAITTDAGDAHLQAILEGRKRVTHGRHCPCSACAQEDWTNPRLAPCGMHGPECPAVYDSIEGEFDRV
jgi:hypothetical protein